MYCCPSRSSNARSPASASVTKSRLLRSVECGWAAISRWATTSEIESWVSTAKTRRNADFLACRKTQHCALGIPDERQRHGFKELVEREIYGLPAVKNCL